MSRLLNALREAQREREGDMADVDGAGDDNDSADSGEPGYFWTSLFMLIVVCGLIVGGFYWLRNIINGSAL